MSSSNTPNNELDDIFNTVFTEKKTPPATPSSAQTGQPQPRPAVPTTAGATIICSACGAQNDASQKFCGSCGAVLKAPPAQPATVYCGKCGAQNDAAWKFCGSCGAPLQRSQPQPVAPVNPVPINGQNASGMLARTSKGYKVASPGAVIAILCFFLPWLFVSCAGSVGTSLTGMDLAFGKQTELMAGMVQRVSGEPLVMLALFAAVAVLVLAGFAIRRGKLHPVDGIGVIGLGVGALILLVLEGLIQSSKMQQDGTAQFVQISPEIGLIGAVIGYLAIIAGGILNQLRKP